MPEPVPIVDEDVLYVPTVTREAGITLGVGRGPFRDYGKLVGMTFYKQRITVGRP